MTAPEVAITELPASSQKKKPKNMTKREERELEVEETLHYTLQREGKGVARKWKCGSPRSFWKLRSKKCNKRGRHLIQRKVLIKELDLERKNGWVEIIFYRREYVVVELVGTTEDTHRAELKNSVVRAIEIAGVNIEKYNFKTSMPSQSLGNRKSK